MMTTALLLVFAYLLGGIPFGYLLVRLRTGEDVRAKGSGNIGATNVLRTAGRGLGVLTLLLDVAKGAVAVWVTGLVTGGDERVMSAAAVAVMLGHGFPVFLKFQGGKAVASVLGAFLVLAPQAIAACVPLFVATVALSRYISLGSILSAAALPLGVWLLTPRGWPAVVAAAACGLFVIWRHTGNIQRLRAGNENVFRWGKKA
jgi:glycerol-3-phosphate acyltransferase PlsY